MRECPGAKRKLIQNAQTIHICKPKKGGNKYKQENPNNFFSKKKESSR